MSAQDNYCAQCKRPHATFEPRDTRDPALCYARLQGRSRRAERNCLGYTIRQLKERVRELEAWQAEVRISHTIGEKSLAAAIAIADAGKFCGPTGYDSDDN